MLMSTQWPPCPQNNFWDYRLARHYGKSGAAGKKRGKLSMVKVKRYKQIKLLKQDFAGKG